MSGPSLLFIHGWGFDAQFWDPLRAALSDLPTEAVDLGYFGAPAAQPVEPHMLVVAHSLGAMLALHDPPPACAGLAAINGFDRFCERPNAPGVPRRLIDRMIAKLEYAAEEVVADYRRRCGADGSFGEIDRRRLGTHLALLRDGDEEERSAAWTQPLLALHGEADPILPPDLRATAFHRAPLLRRASLADGGHLLPLSHPDWCAARIRELIESRK